MKRIVRSHVRRLSRNTRELLFPSVEMDALAAHARLQAASTWAEIFEPLDPLVADAVVLEVGCSDAGLLAHLLTLPDAPARSAIGVSRDKGAASAEADRPRPDFGYVGERLEWHDRASSLDALDPNTFDLIICRDFEQSFAMADVEGGLKRFYDLLRPGGEALLTVRCAGPEASQEGAGYGILTPSSWVMLLLASGFEISNERRLWRRMEDAKIMSSILPLSSEEERMTDEIRLRVVRPWESWELEKAWAAKS